MTSSLRIRGRLLSALLVLILPAAAVAARPTALLNAQGITDFADPAFRQLWERTDLPVSSGEVQRSWYWGPQPGEMKSEPYSGSPSGTRLVQYFDKARMEVNDPQGDRASEWFVTTGLLVAEMVSGKQQTGDRQYKPHRAAEIAVGGDGLSADPDAPTYTSFRPVASLTGPGANRATERLGHAVTATIDRAGNVGDEPALGNYPGARIAVYDDVLGHNIPAAFWEFLNLRGQVREDGETVGDRPLANWVFVMGYPITEAYWSRVLIGGVYHDVMFQMFERRTLAYIPSFAPGWQVQMGNVGAHYYRWLYGGPLPQPRVALPNANGLPPNVNATVEPQTATPGTNLSVSVTGFAAGEEIVSWFTG
ncbi:MAG TPA: hypothetical protein VFR15_13160, partial [Chloroflexia bacterium]|nr:hypothetical protein [Chloroflexia bacterium]